MKRSKHYHALINLTCSIVQFFLFQSELWWLSSLLPSRIHSALCAMVKDYMLNVNVCIWWRFPLSKLEKISVYFITNNIVILYIFYYRLGGDIGYFITSINWASYVRYVSSTRVNAKDHHFEAFFIVLEKSIY